jgi:hypothetical protein
MTPDTPLCDFCGSDQPLWEYRMDPTLPDIVITKVGRFKDGSPCWWACDLCSSMIETDDKMGLHQHTLKSYKNIHMSKVNLLPGDRYEVYLRDMVESFHELFWQRKLEGRIYITNGGR